ncbi:MAG: hypothetical protein R3D67_07230 [Hyphomicrobiaceae bacterium]
MRPLPPALREVPHKGRADATRRGPRIAGNILQIGKFDFREIIGECKTSHPTAPVRGNNQYGIETDPLALTNNPADLLDAFRFIGESGIEHLNNFGKTLLVSLRGQIENSPKTNHGRRALQVCRWRQTATLPYPTEATARCYVNGNVDRWRQQAVRQLTR